MGNRFGSAALLWCAFAAAAHAQGPRRVEIQLIGPCAAVEQRLSGEITVVRNDDESDDAIFPVERLETGRWSGDAPDSIDTRRDHFSLRLPGQGRTDCHEPDQRGGAVARFTFRCCSPQRGRTVFMDVEADEVVGYYLRAVPRSPDEPQSVGCTEYGPFDQPATNVQFARESLRLQLTGAPNQDAPGLLVDDPAVIPNAGQGGSKPFRLHTVVDAFARQRARGRAGTLPTLSSNGREFDYKTLSDIGLRNLKVTVE